MGSQRDVSWMGLVDGDAATFFSVFLSVPSLSQSSKCFSNRSLANTGSAHYCRTVEDFCAIDQQQRWFSVVLISSRPTPPPARGWGRAPPRLKFLSYSIPEHEDIVQILNITSSVKRVFFKFLSVRPNGETKNIKPF